MKGSDGTIRSYFPSANEELIEDVLRKIAADQNNGYYQDRAKSLAVQGGDG